MKKIVIAALLVTAIAKPVAAAEKLYYAGAKLGINSINSANSRAFGVMGGYMLGPDLAVELAYADLGSIKNPAPKGLVKYTILELGAVATFQVTQLYSAFGKLGLAKMSQSGLGLPKVNRVSPTWGLGSRYNYTPTVVIRIGMESYNFGDSFIWNRGGSILYSVSGMYQF